MRTNKSAQAISTDLLETAGCDSVCSWVSLRFPREHLLHLRSAGDRQKVPLSADLWDVGFGRSSQQKMFLTCWQCPLLVVCDVLFPKVVWGLAGFDCFGTKGNESVHLRFSPVCVFRYHPSFERMISV